MSLPLRVGLHLECHTQTAATLRFDSYSTTLFEQIAEDSARNVTTQAVNSNLIAFFSMGSVWLSECFLIYGGDFHA